ncbi:MAG TPA: M20/M25/M40 family metallo-hydrolase [Thermoflexia bacterium]|jgi:acetylornithine deacetylase/succinyl-diaminopimelate desuccinylase-like protein|nr:M20/M25/M40 family metallo-hydrolase [Thermoflexia bacterium]
MCKEIYTDIEAHKTAYLVRLKRLLTQPSISSQGVGLGETADLLTGMLRSLGFKVEQVPIDGPPVIVAQMEGKRPERLLFYNHYDVQPVDPLEEWTTPPFEPTVREGKLYARGAADNKGAIAARLGAIESYLRVHGSLPVGLTWIIEGEEEIGSPHLHQFVESQRELLEGAIGCVWEAGGKNARDRYEIALGCKGMLYLELRVKGAARDLHSAMAATVVNPAWRLLWALNSIKGPDGAIRIPGFYDDVRPPTDAQRQALAEWEYPEEEVRALLGIDAFLDGLTGMALKERLIFAPTCNIDGFHAGYAGPGSKTVLPARAYAKVDFRLVPDQRPERVVEQLREHLDRAGFDDVEIVWWNGEAPAAGDPDHPFVKVAVRTAEVVYGHRPTVLPMMAGTGPVHLLCGQFGVPIVTAGIGYADSRGHAPNENIRLEDFYEGVRYIATLLAYLDRSDPERL